MTANRILPTVPSNYRTRVAHFLEKQVNLKQKSSRLKLVRTKDYKNGMSLIQGFKQQALAVSTDLEHKFELAVQLGNLEVAHELAKEACSVQKWRQLGESATMKGDLKLTEECLWEAQDYGGMLLLAQSSGKSAQSN